MSFVSRRIYQKVTDCALQEGLNPDLLTHHVAPLSSPSAKLYIPLYLLFEVYELGQQHLPPGFSIRVGASMIPEDYGTLGLSWKTSWRARDIFERIARFNILISDIGGIRVLTNGGITEVTLDRPINRIGQAISNETTLVVSVNMMRTVTQTNIIPTKVTFIHKAPEEILSYNNYFGCKVSFGQKTNSIHFVTEDLNIPTIKADKSINQFLLERMEEERKGIEKHANQLVSDINILIKEALPSGIPSMHEVSRHLGMSSRTLTRRLMESNVTFRQLIKNVQEEIAKYLLYSSNNSVSEIAFLTGFSEQSAFNRAFKKWTNQTPLEFRKNQ